MRVEGGDLAAEQLSQQPLVRPVVAYTSAQLRSELLKTPNASQISGGKSRIQVTFTVSLCATVLSVLWSQHDFNLRKKEEEVAESGRFPLQFGA